MRRFWQAVLGSVSLLIPSALAFSASRIAQSAEEAKSVLVAEAERLGSIAGTTPSFAEKTWSNRCGACVTPVSPGVYCADRPFMWNGIDVGGRMAILQLPPEDDDDRPGLLVHSPVYLDDELKRLLNDLGEVRHVISPNYEHVKYASQWAENYPSACIWGCPGLSEREPDCRWTGEIPFGARPPGFSSSKGKADGMDYSKMWDWNLVQPLHIDTEVNPFTGKPFFNEVVFFHEPSKSLLFTDFYWNYPGSAGTNDQLKNEGIEPVGDFETWTLAPSVEVPFGSRMWKFGMDRVFYPFYMRLMVEKSKRAQFEGIGRYMLGLEAECIIPCHGDIIRGKDTVRGVLRKHFNR